MRSYITVNSSILYSNFLQVKKIYKGKIFLVVKSNAYGHDVSVITTFFKDKVDYFCVDSLDEALFLRSLGVSNKILLLDFCPPELINEAVMSSIDISIYSYLQLNLYSKFLKTEPLQIHLEVESGLNRLGMQEDEIPLIVETLKRKNIRLCSLYTHIADGNDKVFSAYQTNRFFNFLLKFKNVCSMPFFTHIGGSGYLSNLNLNQFSGLRLGGAMFGLGTNDPFFDYSLAWHSHFIDIKPIKKGDFVGYGKTWKAERDSLIATVPCGYFDGYDRRMSNVGEMIVHGKKVPVVGRVSMNLVTLDVTEINNLNLNDDVLILGSTDSLSISPKDIASKLGTIDYEIVTRIHPGIVRKLI